MAIQEDRRRITTRLTVLQVACVAVFAALSISFWFLQIVENARYEEMAQNNHQRTLALRAPRGVLYDRNGQVLVENRHSFTISIVREHTKDLDRTVRMLSEVAGLNVEDVRAVVARHRSEPSYRPIVVVDDASLAQVAAITARRLDFELPDVVVEEVPTRQYPGEGIAAHLFGYVGEVSDTMVAADESLKSGDLVGQAGIEKIYNPMLMGKDGAKVVVVNSLGREIRTLEEVAPMEGKRLQLTIDYDLQKAVDDGFKVARVARLTNAGAAIVLDPNTGEVLAYSSEPAFDPNAFAAGIDRATWASLTTDEQRPLNDRALQGRYSPGSTFKMAVALAGLQEGVITPDFKVHCAGGANFYGRTFKCWLKGGHGTTDLRHAIEQSCDVYFYTVANILGVDKINKWATALGLGVKSGIDLPNEVTGLVPSTEWKREKMHEKWYAGETISVGIGQGQVSVTPVSMAVYAATMANGGTRVTPHLLKAIDEGNGWKPVPAPPPQSVVQLDPEKLQAVRDGMWGVVNGGGTGNRARVVGFDVAGKTGTSQVISNAGRVAAARSGKDLRDNGWFVFFAPRDKPEIAGVVFLEHGVHGPNAARVARHILSTFYAKKLGKPLPPPPTPQDMQFDFSDPYGPGRMPGVEPETDEPVNITN
ncbi:MAG TPA: penicillin-binding protein 2 [Vicinamibacterales bacterium]|jgi:penicillin-binding protein 2|nr:penicillin-binding protein 2 [Vicinamibacterales bacterium]